MLSRSMKAIALATLCAPLLAASLVSAQEGTSLLSLPHRSVGERQSNRATPTLSLSNDEARDRHSRVSRARSTIRPRSSTFAATSSALDRIRRAAASAVPQGFGTGGGDIFETESNDVLPQIVYLPVNIFGEISFSLDVDLFIFQVHAGEQINVEAFAARYRGSNLIPLIALVDQAGELLVFDFGTAESDPLIRYVPASDGLLIAGITDVDGLGGFDFDYMLNITRGLDVDEREPNDAQAQELPALPVTLFGQLGTRRDVDFYSFEATAGQTLIVDVDAEVLGSRLDSIINLLDPAAGVQFFLNDQADGNDSRFNVLLPYTGRYVVGIGSFQRASRGFYRLNLSLVPGDGAPIVTRLDRVAKKKLDVSGSGFSVGSIVEVNGIARKTTPMSSGTLRAKVKLRAGDVVTVVNPPDDRRSNPLINLE